MKKVNIEKFKKKLESGFFGFWVKQRRSTFLFMLLIVFTGIYSLYQIPKESSPDIEFGIIAINTVYQWVNPTDIDTLITEKIEQNIKDIEWLKKMSSTSSIWISSIILEFDNGVDMSKALVDVKDAVDKVSLPSESQDPFVAEISTDNERMFDIVLYGNDQQFSQQYIKEKARKLKYSLDGKWNINRIDLGWSDENIYDIYVLLDRAKVEQLGLSLQQIAWSIRAFNQNQPLGNHEIDSLSYDFRIEWELKTFQDLQKIPLVLPNGSFVFLQDIATIEQRLKDDSIRKMWFYQNSGNYFVSMTVNKNRWANIFSSSKDAKKLIEQELSKQEYAGLNIVYTQDLAEYIQKDYNDLANNGLQTILLVFLVLLFFVGFKEAIIATLSVPLAFMITFFVLKQLWLSLNFLTNFSLIICFGIAIDATIVVVQWAHEKMRQGFASKSAVLLSVKDYAIPLLSGTATTLVVFLPMLTLPGIMGKFLAYIPITIFVTLLWSLFIALTINSALFFKLSKPKKEYENIWEIDYLPLEEKVLLEKERQGKILYQQNEKKSSWRERMLDNMASWYESKLRLIMENSRSRVIAFLAPLVALILSFIFISPRLWFNLFPPSDSPWLYATITAKKWISQDYVVEKINDLDSVFNSIPELKLYYYVISNNKIDITLELVEKTERERDSFVIEEEILKKLSYLTSYWLQVETKVQWWWPPTGKAVWVKLIADSNDKFVQILSVAKDFESYLRTIEWTKNVAISSSPSPWQFVFKYYIDKLSYLWIQPSELNFQLYAVINWISAWSIRWQYENSDIKIKYTDFDERLTPNNVEDISLPTTKGFVKIGALTDYSFDQAITEIGRENGKIVVKVDADIKKWYSSAVLQSEFVEFAQKYSYPDGISFQSWWENEENMDLIVAMVVSFIVAIFLILAILILQFNSYLQPAIITYSIVVWVLGANIGLWVTGNSYSMTFMIWFIALTGIVVNNAIVLIDRINVDVARWKNMFDAILETGKSRFAPILSTTMTTVLGLSSVARQDEFFAGLSYTIMFGLAFSSAMTLLVVPAIYYDKEKLIQILKRTILSFIVWFALPFVGIAWLMFVGILVGLKFWTYSWFSGFIGFVFVVYIVWYAWYVIKSTQEKWQTFLQKYLWITVLNMNWSKLNKKQSIKRFIVQFWLLIAPFLVWGILSPLFWSFAIWLSVLLFFGYIFRNIYVFWISDHNQLWHDKICGTKVIYVQKKKEED